MAIISIIVELSGTDQRGKQPARHSGKHSYNDCCELDFNQNDIWRPGRLSAFPRRIRDTQ
jgi:hypothetical protein